MSFSVIKWKKKPTENQRNTVKWPSERRVTLKAQGRAVSYFPIKCRVSCKGNDVSIRRRPLAVFCKQWIHICVIISQSFFGLIIRLVLHSSTNFSSVSSAADVLSTAVTITVIPQLCGITLGMMSLSWSLQGCCCCCFFGLFVKLIFAN